MDADHRDVVYTHPVYGVAPPLMLPCCPSQRPSLASVSNRDRVTDAIRYYFHWMATEETARDSVRERESLT